MTIKFRNDFEDDFASWTINQSSGAATFGTTEEYSHHGSKSARAVFGNSFSDKAYAMKNFGDMAGDVFARIVFKCTDFTRPAGTNREIPLLMLHTSDGSTDPIDVFLQRTFLDAYVFYVYYRNGVVQVGVNTGVNWVLGTQYTLEVKKNQAAVGEYRLYLNGTSVWSVVADTSAYDVGRILVGNDGYLGGSGDGTYSAKIYWECVEVSDAIIGVESADVPIVYEENKITVKETTQLPSTTIGAVGERTRVRTLRHLTPISPWTAE